jgi:hypothetical protein
MSGGREKPGGSGNDDAGDGGGRRSGKRAEREREKIERGRRKLISTRRTNRTSMTHVTGGQTSQAGWATNHTQQAV